MGQQIPGTMESENPTGTLRLFVAIPVPEPVRNEMIRVQRELQTAVPPGGIRWTRPDQLHLTLRFLGEVLAAEVDNLKHSVGTVCENVRAPRLRAEGIAFFPGNRSPSVIWAGIRDDEGRLVDLQKQIEAAVQPFTSGGSVEKFTGHVTLGRVKKTTPAGIRKLTAQA